MIEPVRARLVQLLVGLARAAIALAIRLAWHVSRALLAVAITHGARWKMNLHLGGVAGSVTVFVWRFGLFGPLRLVLTLLGVLVALVGWARWRVGAHSVAQAVVATLLAAHITDGTFWLMGMPVALPRWDITHPFRETVHGLPTRGGGLSLRTGHDAAIDSTTPAGRWLFVICAALADFDRELIIVRTKAGLACARVLAANVVCLETCGFECGSDCQYVASLKRAKRLKPRAWGFGRKICRRGLGIEVGWGPSQALAA